MAICFSVNIANLKTTKTLIAEARRKNPKAMIIVGGPFSESRAKLLFEFLKPDFIAVGEAEFTLLDILEGKKDIRGVVMKVNNKLIFTGDRVPTINLDQFPFPALDKVPIKKYNYIPKKKFPISQIMTSRGCPSKCIFCSHNSIWRQRSALNVVDEIEWQVKSLGVKEISIMDDNFTLNRKRVIDICNLILERKIKVCLQLGNGARSDRLDYDLLELMKKAGLWLVGIAPEVGYAKGLQKIEKGFTHKHVESVVRWCKKLNLVTYAFYTLGYPWEKEHQIKKTTDYAVKLDTDMVQFTRVIPIEGTPLYESLNLSAAENLSEEGYFIYKSNYMHPFIPDERLQALIKDGYRTFFLRPKKMISLLQKLKILDLMELGKYALITKSM